MIGGPGKGEAAEFHWSYIDLVQGDDVAAVLVDQLTRFDGLLGGLTEERSLYRYEPGKWSIRESLGHVVDAERIFAGRALWFARGLPDPLPGFDQNVAVAGAEADRVKVADHLEEFRQVRLSTLALFRNLPEAAWLRVGTASGASISVRALAFAIAGHAEHHRRILSERYLG